MSENIFLSKRMENISFSNIRQIFEEANRLERSGSPIIHMEIGRPDFDTDKRIKYKTSQALDKGYVHYSSSAGVLELRQAIADKLEQDNKIKLDPNSEVVVTAGCKEAIMDTLLTYIDPGDEVLLPEPGWSTYREIVEFIGGSVVSVPLKEANNFELDPADVLKHITKKTKMMVLCSPHNPTGAVLDYETIKQLAEISIENNLLVISDEIYEKVIYEDSDHISIGSLPGMKERTITINGFSKAYAMDGWRLGYVAGEEKLIQPILKVHQHNTNCVNTFAQHGAIEAYRGSQHSVDLMVEEFNRRRVFLVNNLNDIKGVNCVMPKGAFYVFPSFSGYGLSSKEMATYLLREAGVACIPGDSFGAEGEGYIRMSYATDFESIKKAVDKIKKALLKLERSEIDS